VTTIVDCPQSDRGQWSFRLFGTPVAVKFWFWIALLLLNSDRGPAGEVIWVAVCFVSILLHEMGHVFAFRFFRRNARVVLYGFGGMAIPDRDVDGPFPAAVVAVAGPAAGFCLAGLTLAAAILTGGSVHLGRNMFLPHLTAMLNYRMLLWPHGVSLYTHAILLVNDLLFVNFYWGLVNLLPVWPLDGGHIMRAVFEQWDGYDGRRKSLMVSAIVGGAVALAGFASQNMWLAIMFALFAVSSLQSMQGERRWVIPAYRRWRD
jgi:stage IV sporulation protein FB